MSELTFEQMLEESLKTIHTGEVIEGTVIDVKPDEAILNIGYKSDGILTRNEYTNEPNVDLTTLVNVGDKMEVKVLKVNDGEGQVLLTYKRLLAERGNERLKEAFENKEVLKAPVVQILGGGLSVVVDEARVFIPASLVSDTYEKDLTKYQNQEIEFVISEFNPRRNRIIGDRRQLLVAEKAEKQKEVYNLVLKANEAAEAAIKPGMKLSEIDAVIYNSGLTAIDYTFSPIKVNTFPEIKCISPPYTKFLVDFCTNLKTAIPIFSKISESANTFPIKLPVPSAKHHTQTFECASDKSRPPPIPLWLFQHTANTKETSLHTFAGGACIS